MSSEIILYQNHYLQMHIEDPLQKQGSVPL